MAQPCRSVSCGGWKSLCGGKATRTQSDTLTRLLGLSGKLPVARKRLPDTRQSITHKVEITDPSIGSFDLYITLGLYPNGKPGELFLKMGKVGSTVNGLLDAVGVLSSLLLQHSANVEALCDKLSSTAFMPAGTTSNPDIPVCTSLVDYVFRWVQQEQAKLRRGGRRGKAG